MYSRLTYLITAIILCLSFSKAYTQTDSTHYDLGRMRLDKKFTQGITIKAADLEHQPFSNLSEAINVWFYGTYTSSNNMVYVIDGNLVNDVNVYNINDIDEITLVQNSAIQLNGATPLQQLVLIKTKRSRAGKLGIEATGQTNLVTIRTNTNAPDLKSTTNLYHQYFLSGYKNTQNINAGVSATYLRDVLPVLKTTATTVSTPLSFDRFKFNGYADVKLGSNNTLSTTVNYVPQVSRFEYNNAKLPAYVSNPFFLMQTDLNDHDEQNLINAGIQLNSQIVTGLSNKLSASYNNQSYQRHYVFNNFTTSEDYGIRSNYRDSSFNSRKVLLIQDNLNYRKTGGSFTFETSINFSYRYTHDSIVNSTYNRFYSGNSPVDPNNANAYAITHDSSFYKRKDYRLLYSLGISYKNSINIQGGFLAVLDSRKNLNLKDADSLQRAYPFVSATFDISSLANINVVGIKLYASYAQQSTLLQAANTQLMGINTVYSNTLIPNPPFASRPITYNSTIKTYNPIKPFNTYVLGTDIDINKIISVNYNFERSHLQIPFIYYQYFSNPPTSYTIFTDTKYTANRIGLNFNIINKGATRFISGINTINISLKASPGNTPIALGSKIWTGGWVNRLEVNNIFAGLDILYQFHKGNDLLSTTTTYTSASDQSIKSFSLQNIYFGYRLKTNQFKNLELFANGRNVWQNKKSVITDNRRFYGFGFKLDL